MDCRKFTIFFSQCAPALSPAPAPAPDPATTTVDALVHGPGRAGSGGQGRAGPAWLIALPAVAVGFRGLPGRADGGRRRRQVAVATGLWDLQQLHQPPRRVPQLQHHLLALHEVQETLIMIKWAQPQHQPQPHAGDVSKTIL